MNIIEKMVLKLKKKNITYRIPKEAQLVRKVERTKLDNNDYLINDSAVNKEEFIKQLSKWVRASFVFQNLDVHLPREVDMPVDVTEDLTNLNKFKSTGMKALEYLILCVLTVGIKIGREMERNEDTEK